MGSPERQGPVDATVAPKPKPKRKNTTSVRVLLQVFLALLTIFQSKLKEWLPFRDSFLNELLRHDGHGDYLGSTICLSCGQEGGVLKCRECFSGSLLRCRACVLQAHQDHPLHHVEVRSACFNIGIV